MNDVFQIKKELFFDVLTNPESEQFQQFGQRFFNKIGVLDYELESKNDQTHTHVQE